MIVTFLVERASRAMSLLLHACDRLHLCDTQGSVGAMSARERNSHRHRGSFSSAALDVEPATVALDDVLHDRQAQPGPRSEEHTSELQSRENLVCRLLLEKKK